MKLIKYEPKYTQNAIAIRVNKGNVNISVKAYEILGKPKNVDIFYDAEAKIIKLEINPQGLQISMPSPHIGCSLYKVMPKGHYLYKEDEKIFIYSEPGK